MKNITLYPYPSPWYRQGQNQTWGIILENTDSDPIGIEGVFHLSLNEEIIQSTPFVTQVHGEFNEKGIAQLNLDEFLPDWVQGSEGDLNLSGILYYEQIDLEIPFGPLPVKLDTFKPPENYIYEIPSSIGMPLPSTSMGAPVEPIYGSSEVPIPNEILSPPEEDIPVAIPPLANSTVLDFVGGCPPPQVVGELETTTNETSFIYGDPIFLHNGEFVRSERDLYLEGVGFPLSFVRTYRSRIIGGSRLGKKWDFSWNKWLERTGTGIIFHNGFGRTDLFKQSPTDSHLFLPPMGYYAQLREYPNSLSGKSKYIIEFANEATYHFNSKGKLLKIEDSYKNSQLFIWNSKGLLTEVKDTRGNIVKLSYSSKNGLLIKLEDWIGRIISYEYYSLGETGGLADTLKSMTINDPTNQLPSQTINYTYATKDPRIGRQYDLLKITEAGKLKPIIKNDYDNEGKVIEQSFQNTHQLFTYNYYLDTNSNDQITEVTVTDQDGKNFRFKMKGEIPLEIEFIHNSNLNLKEIRRYDDLAFGFYEVTNVQFSRGDSVQFTYDRTSSNPLLRNRLIETLEYEAPQFGNKIKKTQFQWHPYKALIMSVISPRGFETNVNPLDFQYSYEYDNQGNLTKLIEPKRSIYDREGNLISSYRRSSSFEYNRKGLLIKKINYLGIVSEIIYGNFGYDKDLPIAFIYDSSVNPLTTQLNYDQLGRIVRIENPNGMIWEVKYNIFNQLIQLSANDGITLKYLYNSLGQHIATLTRNLAPQILQNGITSSENWVEDTNHPWIKQIFEYDIWGNIIAIREEISMGEFKSQYFEYEAYNRLEVKTEAEGETTHYEYNSHGQIVAIFFAKHTLAGQRKFQYEYNQFGYKTRFIDAEGKALEWEYDGFGRIGKITNPKGHTLAYKYDAGDNVIEISQRDNNGLLITLQKITYDEMDMSYQLDDFEVDSIGGLTGKIFRTSKQYDTHTGLVIQESAGLTNIGEPVEFLFYERDRLGRVIIERDLLGNEFHHRYDKLGRIYQMQNYHFKASILIPGMITEFDYDKRDWQIRKRIMSPDGIQMTQYSRSMNSRGLVVFEQNPVGHTKAYQYDGLGQLIVEESHRRLGEHHLTPIIEKAQTRYQYNHSGNLISSKDANGNITHYEYNVLGLLIKMTYSGGSYVSYFYDRNNELTFATFSDGTRIRYSYDATGLLIKKTIKQTDNIGNNILLDEEIYAWDSSNRIIEVSNTTSNIKFEYDNFDNLIATDQNGVRVEKSINGLGQRIGINLLGNNLMYDKDSLGRNLNIHTSKAAVQYQYLGHHFIERKINGNGTNASFKFDGLGQLTDISNQSINNQLPINQNFQLDDKGRKTTINFQNAKHTYKEQYHYNSYDSLIQTKRTGNIPNLPETTEYHLDALANRKNIIDDTNSMDYYYNTNNQYIQVGNLAYSYDERGNLISDGQRTFTYDFRNRLINATVQTGNITYNYDALNRLIKKVFLPLGSTTPIVTKFIYEGFRCIAELDENNQIKVHYHYGNGLNEVIFIEKNGQVYYLHQQQLGSISHVTDEQGNLVEEYIYHEYGKRIILDANGNILTNSIIENPFGFTGHYYDNDLGLYYMRARFYDPKTGGFLSRDWIQDIEQYKYVNGNPVNFVDPFGLEPHILTVAIYDQGKVYVEIFVSGFKNYPKAAQAAALIHKVGSWPYLASSHTEIHAMRWIKTLNLSKDAMIDFFGTKRACPMCKSWMNRFHFIKEIPIRYWQSNVSKPWVSTGNFSIHGVKYRLAQSSRAISAGVSTFIAGSWARVAEAARPAVNVGSRVAIVGARAAVSVGVRVIPIVGIGVGLVTIGYAGYQGVKALQAQKGAAESEQQALEAEEALQELRRENNKDDEKVRQLWDLVDRAKVFWAEQRKPLPPATRSLEQSLPPRPFFNPT